LLHRRVYIAVYSYKLLFRQFCEKPLHITFKTNGLCKSCSTLFPLLCLTRTLPGPSASEVTTIWRYTDVYIIIIRSHRNTTYVDAVYCYRPRSVVCRSVYHTCEPCKIAEAIELPFGLRTWVGTGNHVLDGVHIPHKNGQFWGKGLPIVKYRDFLP